MQNFKSHFTFSKEQRNGIFLLLIIIIVAQCVYFFIDYPSNNIQVNKEELLKYTKEIDSLRFHKTQENKPKIYPFNPNYITDYKGSSLGMSNEEIDRLLTFRKQNKWINSTKQFQEITKVSDSLLKVLSPNFKFPEWVTNPKPRNNSFQVYNSKPRTYANKQDLNKVTAQQLQKVNGVGKVLDAVKLEVGDIEDGMSEDGLFTISEVECLGACVESPLIQVNKDYETKLTADSAVELIKKLKAKG